MRQLNKYTLNVRRESLLKAIRTQHREQFKADRRATLLEHHARARQADEIYRFRLALFTLNLSNEQARVLDFLAYLQKCAISKEQGELIVNSLIVDELICLIANSLMQSQELEASLLVEGLFHLLYHLLACTTHSIAVIQRHLSQLVYLLHRYPHSGNIDKLSRFLTCLHDSPSQPVWREQYLKRKAVGEEEVGGRLMEIYILRESYTVKEGSYTVKEGSYSIREGKEVKVVKQSRKWFKNAIKCMEVVYGLLLIRTELAALENSNDSWETEAIKGGLYEGLSVFLNQQKFFIQQYDSQSTDSDSMAEAPIFKGEMVHQSAIESEESNLYFISVILDILLLKETVMSEHEEKVLRGMLGVLLGELDRYSIVNMTAIKVIKLLYEQLVLQEEELMDLAAKYHHLQPLIHTIIKNDLI